MSTLRRWPVIPRKARRAPTPAAAPTSTHPTSIPYLPIHHILVTLQAGAGMPVHACNGLCTAPLGSSPQFHLYLVPLHRTCALAAGRAVRQRKQRLRSFGKTVLRQREGRSILVCTCRGPPRKCVRRLSCRTGPTAVNHPPPLAREHDGGVEWSMNKGAYLGVLLPTSRKPSRTLLGIQRMRLSKLVSARVQRNLSGGLS